jgi:hypothetical protein
MLVRLTSLLGFASHNPRHNAGSFVGRIHLGGLLPIFLLTRGPLEAQGSNPRRSPRAPNKSVSPPGGFLLMVGSVNIREMSSMCLGS